MSGSKSGGQAARDTNYKRFGLDFYAVVGSFGGRNGRTGGFYANRELARVVGAIGGSVSRRRAFTPLEKLNRKAENERKEREAYFKRRLAEIKERSASRRRQIEELSEMSQDRLTARFGVQRPW